MYQTFEINFIPNFYTNFLVNFCLKFFSIFLKNSGIMWVPPPSRSYHHVGPLWTPHQLVPAWTCTSRDTREQTRWGARRPCKKEIPGRRFSLKPNVSLTSLCLWCWECYIFQSCNLLLPTYATCHCHSYTPF